jgi:hypothetical protein
MFALELASVPVTSSFSDRFGAGGGSGANGDEAASSIPPEFRSKYSTSFADYPQPLSDPVRTRIWGPPIVRGSVGKPFSLRFYLLKLMRRRYSYGAIDENVFFTWLCVRVRSVFNVSRANFNSPIGFDQDLMIFFAVPCVNRFQPKKSYRVSFNSRETCPCRVIRNLISPIFLYLTADPGGPGICAFILTLFSFLLILATFPLSLCFSVKVTYIFTFNLMIRDYRILFLLSYGNNFQQIHVVRFFTTFLS